MIVPTVGLRAREKIRWGYNFPNKSPTNGSITALFFQGLLAVNNMKCRYSVFY